MRDAVVLADADNFFASCETVFHPALRGRPLVVLSNNDGCVVSRSAAAKALGLANGVPWFVIRDQASRLGVVARSSNYELYASLSRRMMILMSHFFADQERYSIDECFLRSSLGVIRTRHHAAVMRETVLHGLGIPVSIGIAPTRTLAKIVIRLAKHDPHRGGVATWPSCQEGDIARATSPSRTADDLLAQTPIGDVWGVGRRLSKRLLAAGIPDALHLRDADPVLIRRRHSVVLERTVLELRGIPCPQPPSDASDGRRTGRILCSRMFSHPLGGTDDAIAGALSVYAQRACTRLRRQGSVCSRVSAFCSGRPRSPSDPGAWAERTVILDDPSDDPLVVAAAACGALRGRLDPDSRYVRAGVMLTGLSDRMTYDSTLNGLGARRDDHRLGSVLDLVTGRYGPSRIGIGCAGIRSVSRDHDIADDWGMRRSLLSPRSTTHWEEMAVVHAV
ncbi:Y-family DNA polymerase [uncultured Bifidobacterium sp.]|uniref:Y-family DNA polymerase n=1 Tax=uncultured Bifidobacterium sp. TaxID=165187 RepID=UPI0028DB0761|nr:Y-family DNA polymerase [uncultured Bifidobacterium sp.]